MDKMKEIIVAANRHKENPMERGRATKKIADLLSGCDEKSLNEALKAISGRLMNGNGKMET